MPNLANNQRTETELLTKFLISTVVTMNLSVFAYSFASLAGSNASANVLFHTFTSGLANSLGNYFENMKKIGGETPNVNKVYLNLAALGIAGTRSYMKGDAAPLVGAVISMGVTEVVNRL